MLDKSYYFNTYSHQLIGGVYNGLLQYIDRYLFGGERFKTKTISTYNKAIQTLNQNDKYTAYYPALCIDPSFAIGPSELENSLLQKFPVGGGISAFIYDPIIKTDDIIIAPGYTRITTSVTVIMWFDSVFEHFDSQMRMMQAFSGMERLSRPFTVTSMNPVPYKLVTDTGQEYNIDWSDVTNVNILDVTGQQYNMLPVVSQPYFKLTNIGDGTDKYGANDISEIRVIFDLITEVDILSFFAIMTDWKIKKLYYTILPDSIDIMSVNNSSVIFSDSNDYYVEEYPPNVSSTKSTEVNEQNTVVQIQEEGQETCSVTDNKTLFISIYRDQPIDISDKISEGYNSVYVMRNGEPLLKDTDYTVDNNIYTLTSYDKAYLMLFQT